MASSRDVILKLVKMAIGWETDFSLPDDIDWKNVLKIAQEQGVNAIAIDGLEVYMSKQPQESAAKNSAPFKQILLEAIGGLQMVEYNYTNHVAALKELSEILNNKDIPFMIMKGFACGQYYPNPKHRPCGDIDIYPGKMFEESNLALKEAGFDADLHYYRHSVSYIKKVMIENHRMLGDLRGPKKQTREMEVWLEREANRSLEDGKPVKVLNQEIKGGVYPSANFNALFLPWHVSDHLAFESVSLRHLLDWALFLTHESHGINIEMYKDAKKKFSFGFSKVADVLTNLSIRYLNMPCDGIPIEIINEAESIDNGLSDKVFNYMFEGQPREHNGNIWKIRVTNFSRVWSERWKYKDLYGINIYSFLFYKIYGAIFKIGN